MAETADAYDEDDPRYLYLYDLEKYLMATIIMDHPEKELVSVRESLLTEQSDLMKDIEENKLLMLQVPLEAMIEANLARQWKRGTLLPGMLSGIRAITADENSVTLYHSGSVYSVTEGQNNLRLSVTPFPDPTAVANCDGAYSGVKTRFSVSGGNLGTPEIEAVNAAQLKAITRAMERNLVGEASKYQDELVELNYKTNENRQIEMIVTERASRQLLLRIKASGDQRIYHYAVRGAQFFYIFSPQHGGGRLEILMPVEPKRNKGKE